MKEGIQRRDFLKRTALAGVGIAAAPYISLGKSSNKDKVRIALIGVGYRGRNHLQNLLNNPDVFIPAIADIDPEALKKANEMIDKAGHKKVDIYTGHDYAYRDMLERKDIDGVIISTPWLWHTPMAVDTMKAGKYAGVEVSAATTLPECWDLVNTYEETGSHCMILENVCYRRDVLAVLNMVREGIFGETVHARCGYLHDLRAVKFNDGKSYSGPGVEFGEKGHAEARWRTQHSLKRNADLYPTHGAGPIATMLDINRGNRFMSLTSTSTKGVGLHDYIVKHPAGGPDHPNAKLKWKLGDVVTTTITTARGESIIVTHDVNLPRPYSLGFRMQGTGGIIDFDYHTRRLFIEGQTKDHWWEEADPHLEKYDHPLWKKFEKEAEGGGHGGMDFFMDRAFVEAVKRKEHPPMDAYDAAAWSAITPLSERSIANNGEPQDFPDFTRGKCINNKPIFGIREDY